MSSQAHAGEIRGLPSSILQTTAPQDDDVRTLARNCIAPHHVDGALHRTRQIWASCDQEMLGSALFLSIEMGRGAKVTHLLMKPLQVPNKRQSCAGGGNKSGRCSECSGAVVRLTRSVTSPATGMGPSHSQTCQQCLTMLRNVLMYFL